VKTLYGYEISPDEPLPHSTLAPWIKRIGVLTAFPEVESSPSNSEILKEVTGDVSTALQNLMMQHANIRTLINHYFSRCVTVDTQAIVHGLDPQYAVMRALQNESMDRPRLATKAHGGAIFIHQSTSSHLHTDRSPR
jgi:hypothetical protein